MMIVKRFNSPIENALCGCQFGVKLGKNRGYPYCILTPNKRVLSFQVPDVCAKFRRNRFKIATVRARTDRQTDRQTHRDHTGDLIICPMLCYSNGTDKKQYMQASSNNISWPTIASVYHFSSSTLAHRRHRATS